MSNKTYKVCDLCGEYGKQTVQLKDQNGLYESCFDCLAQAKVKG